MEKMNAQNNRTSPLARLTPALAYPAAILAALWITAGRVLFGAGGDLVPIFAITFAPLLLIAMGISAATMRREAAQHQPKATTPLIATVYWGAFALALMFGFLVPDRVQGCTLSAASQIIGQDVIGLSAGFGNTIGILTLCLAVASFFLALNEKKKTDRALAGVDEEELEAKARQNYTYDFLD